MQQITLMRTKERRPVTFQGILIKAAERVVGRPGKQRRFYLALYQDKTTDSWVLGIEYGSTFSGEHDSSEVMTFATDEQLALALQQYDPTRHVWLPAGAQFEKKRQRSYENVQRIFSACAAEILRDVTGASEMLGGTGWTCDACGRPVERVEDGALEWFARPSGGSGYGLRLIHSGVTCSREIPVEFDEEGGGLHEQPLTDYLGPDGLMMLVGMIQHERLPRDELAEMIKRLHVPAYEAARPFLRRAEEDGFCDLEMPPGCYSQSMLRMILDRYGRD